MHHCYLLAAIIGRSVGNLNTKTQITDSIHGKYTVSSVSKVNRTSAQCFTMCVILISKGRKVLTRDHTVLPATHVLNP